MTSFKANLLCMASMLVWAMGLPAADYLIGIVPPLWLGAMRMTLAAAVLLPVWALAEGGGVLWRAPWGLGLGIGLLLGAGVVLLVIAQAASDPVTVAVIAAAMPVIGIGLESLFDGRRITLRVALGIGLSLVGGLMAYAQAIGGLQLGLGAVAAFGSITVYTLGSRLTVTRLPRQSALGQSALTLAGAALVTTAVALAGAGLGLAGPDWPAFGAQQALALAVFAILGMAMSQILWIAGIGRLGVGLGALHINAAPFYVMIFMFALGSAWNWMQALGAAVVGAGVLIAQSGPQPNQTKG